MEKVVLETARTENGYRECWEYIRMERRWRERCRYIEDCLDDMWGDICRRKLEGF